jgi:hypothetical protein
LEYGLVMQLVRHQQIPGLPIVSEPAAARPHMGTCRFCQQLKMLEGEHCSMCAEYLEEESRSMWVIGWLALGSVLSMAGLLCFVAFHFLGR